MTEQNSISRRSVAKGAAWSVPVVAAAVAAPAASASPLTACPPASCFTAINPSHTEAAGGILNKTFTLGFDIFGCNTIPRGTGSSASIGTASVTMGDGRTFNNVGVTAAGSGVGILPHGGILINPSFSIPNSTGTNHTYVAKLVAPLVVSVGNISCNLTVTMTATSAFNVTSITIS